MFRGWRIPATLAGATELPDPAWTPTGCRRFAARSELLGADDGHRRREHPQGELRHAVICLIHATCSWHQPPLSDSGG